MSDLSTGFDPSNRDLCPDGACIGVIGPDGRCKICGRQGPAGSAQRAQNEPEGGADEAPVQTARAPAKDVGENNRPDLDVETRELCPDGACIGVIGPDGRCKICGRSK